MISNTLYSSARIDWATPRAFFKKLDDEFHFTIDVCASPENACCERYYTEADNGLIQPWGGERVWCNPPYGKNIIDWCAKMDMESKRAEVIVALMHARTDTKWFHQYVYHKAELRFVKGRLKFGESKNSAPFPSMLAIWRRNEQI